MPKEIFENLICLIWNTIWFGSWMYVIFILDNSGWWILIPIILHCNNSKDD